MKNKKDLRMLPARAVLFSLLLALCLSACRDEILPEAQPDPANEPSVPVQLQVTRSGEAGSATYQALLYTSATANTFNNTGTYRDPDASGDYLTPCNVSADGTWTSDGTSYGLRANAANYLLALVSPAVKPVTITTGRTGYLLSREPQGGETELKFSPPLPVYVYGISIDSKYRYTVLEKLMPRRAKVTFKFTCGNDIEEAVLKGLTLTNLIKSGYYLPQASRFEPKEKEDLVLLAGGATSDSWITMAKGSAPHTFSPPQYILPMDYSPVNELGKPVYDTPVLVIGNGDAVLNYPLLYDFKPLHEYTYSFIINSNNIIPTLTVEAWQDGGTTDTDNEPRPTMEITLPAIQLSGWEAGGTSNDGIGS